MAQRAAPNTYFGPAESQDLGAGPIGPSNPRPEGGYIRHSRDSGSALRVDGYLPTYKRLSRGGRRKEAESGRRRREEGGVG